MAAGRGLGVTPQDLDSSRLVFVSVRDAKPKRKVAVPIPDGASWDQFVSQVQNKLKLSGVEAIHLASTGEQVTRLDQLQDIDELYVREGTTAMASSSQTNGYGSSMGHMHRMGIADTALSPAMSRLDEDSDAAKYVKRQTSVQRTMKRIFPSLFSQQALPVTNKDLSPLSPVEQVRRRIKRRRRSWTDPRFVIIIFALLSSLATLLFVYLRASQTLP